MNWMQYMHLYHEWEMETCTHKQTIQIILQHLIQTKKINDFHCTILYFAPLSMLIEIKLWMHTFTNLSRFHLLAWVSSLYFVCKYSVYNKSGMFAIKLCLLLITMLVMNGLTFAETCVSLYGENTVAVFFIFWAIGVEYLPKSYSFNITYI